MSRLSLGGGWTISIGFLRSNLFGAVGGHIQPYWAARVEEYLRFNGETWREKPER